MSSPSVLRTVIQPKSTSGQTSVMPASGREPDASQPQFDQNNDLATQLGILIENAPVALSMFDEQMRYIVANRFWIEEFGLQNEQPIYGRSQYEIFPGLHPGWRQVYDRALQGNVVRSEHDAISGQDGKPIVYRWEVRPWRRMRDASVGGLMVICEKLAPGNGSAATETETDEPAVSTKDTIHPVSDLLFHSALPIVILDADGVVLQANDAAVEISLSRGIREGSSFYWEAFGEGLDQAALKEQTLSAIANLAQNAVQRHQTLLSRISDGSTGVQSDIAGPPARWTLSKTVSDPGETKYVAVATFGSSSSEVEKPNIPSNPQASPSVDPALVRDLQEKLNLASQEVAVLREAELAFAKREGRQRAVLEGLACGLIVLDERGMPIYHNEHIGRLLGRGVQRGESVEQWLMQACPTQAHKEKVAGLWAHDVWSRQLTRVMSLVTADGLVKELEFRPVTLNGGGVLVSIHDVTDQCRVEDLLQSTEAKFRVLLHDNPAGVLLLDNSGAVFEVNPLAEQMIGRAKADLRRMKIDEWLSPESAVARKEALRQMREEGRHSAALDVQIKHAQGMLRPAHLRIALVNDADDQPHCTLHFLQPALVTIPETPAPVMPPEALPDPAHQNAAAPQTVETQITVRWLLQTDQSGRVAKWSADAREVFGFEDNEIVGSWLHFLFRPSDPTGFYAALQGCTACPEEAVTWGFFGKEGRRGGGRFFVKPAGDGGNAVDLFEEHETLVAVTQPSQAAAEFPTTRTHIVKPSQLWPVADLDREKLLLSETHHRIKNHLQIISSMLNLQLNSLTDHGARAALRSSQNRVRSIAALHQHLYQLALGEGPGFVEFADGLSQRLRECYEVPEDQVAIRLNIAAGHLQQEWMMPLALILNETLSNAFEHAFPGGRQGSVTVSLILGDGTGEFVVSDDGIGLPEGFDPSIAPGLGLKILGVFAEQMRGELKLSGEPNEGTKFNLRFPMAYVDN